MMKRLTGFLISFKLTPVGEMASGSEFKVVSQKKALQLYYDCIEKIFIEAKFGLILKTPVRISMPVKILPF